MLNAVADDDILLIQDVSDTTDGPNGTTKGVLASKIGTGGTGGGGGGGASDAVDVAITDTGGLYTATNVEAALAEVKTIADSALGGGLVGIVDDTSPQLGGNLDTNGFDIVLDAGDEVQFTNSTVAISREVNNLVLESGASTIIRDSFGSVEIASGGLTAETVTTQILNADEVVLTEGATVDGRDLSVDGTKLDGIQEGATAGPVDSVNGDQGAVLVTVESINALSARDGGGGIINVMTGVTGARALNLSDGNVQHIASTAGNYTLGSPSGGLTGRDRMFMLVIDTTTTGHTPTWFGSLTWVNGAAPTITWTGGTRQYFQFWSGDGTNWTGWHLTPAAPVDQVAYSVSGTLVAGAGGFRLYNDSGFARTITTVRASVGTAPTGASILVDVHKNGTTIFTTQGDRPTIAVSTNTDTATPNVTSWANGDYLTVDVDQIGSTIAGADLTVTVNYTQAA
jgi:hypothetical protein